ncbi:MAG: carbohydrate ABC transporter permease [Gemmatimonadaceae bacterium]
MATATAASTQKPVARSEPTERSQRWGRRAPLLPALVFAIIVTQLPFLLTLWYSLRSWNLVRPGSDHFVGLSNYTQVFGDTVFRGALLHTVLLTGGCVVISTVLGLGLAVLLDREFVGQGVVRTLLITPFLVMPVAIALLWKYMMFDPVYGIINWVLAPLGVSPTTDWVTKFPLTSVLVALVWQWTPFMMLLILAGLQAQPKDALEAAQVDGASTWKTFVFVTMPHLRRYIELAVLLGTIYIVNTFDQIYMMTQGGPGTASTNLPFYIYQRAFLGFDVGQAAAMGVIVVIGTIVIATFALRLLFASFQVEET